MASGCARDNPTVAQHLESFTREGVTITQHDWVMVTTADVTVVGRVSELAQMHVYTQNASVVSLVRILIEHVVSRVFDSEELVTVSATGDGLCMCIPLECAHISYMSREVHDGVLRLRLS